MKIATCLIFLAALNLAGCITYYRPDPLSEIDPSRTDHGATAGVGFSHYAAKAYFNGQGTVPHTKTTERPELKYTREDIALSVYTRIRGFTDFFAVLPISSISQLTLRPGVGKLRGWGIEHVWIGASLLRSSNRRANLLFVAGFPVNGRLFTPDYEDESYDNSVRLMLEPLLSNSMPPGRFSYYLRLGAGIHLNPNVQGVSSIHELPGELRVLVPVGKTVHLGFRTDAKFTLITYTDDRGTQSHDVVGIGPYASLALAGGWHIDAGYRSEVIGYYSSAGSSWNVNMTYDFAAAKR